MRYQVTAYPLYYAVVDLARKTGDWANVVFETRVRETAHRECNRANREWDSAGKVYERRNGGGSDS